MWKEGLSSAILLYLWYKSRTLSRLTCLAYDMMTHDFNDFREYRGGGQLTRQLNSILTDEFVTLLTNTGDEFGLLDPGQRRSSSSYGITC